ncbi:hypothetical protein KC966_18325, partial [Proteus terrae]|uniref:hypothetical protein n=1 Tax=Proteus terrae TaxID=1574161 RepID=UPI00331593EA
TIDLQGKTVNNLKGQIATKANFTAETQGWNNTSGLIHALNITGKDLTINSHQQIINNRETKKSGGIVSQGKLTLESGELDNQ